MLTQVYDLCTQETKTRMCRVQCQCGVHKQTIKKKKRLEKMGKGEKKNKEHYNSWEFRNEQGKRFGRRNPVAMGGEAVKKTREIRHN